MDFSQGCWQMEENRKITYIIYMSKCYKKDMYIGTSSHY